MILVSPTEHPDFHAIGKSSGVPERYGMDAAWHSRGELGGLWGVQRKEIKDLLASVRDGRIAIEIAQSAVVGYKVMVVEGKMRWSDEGLLLNGRGWGRDWKRGDVDAMLWSLRADGWWVVHTDSHAHTVSTVVALAAWSRKDRHDGLRGRVGSAKGPVFGMSAGDRETAVWLLQGFPGVGRGLAGAMFDKVGMPLRWDVTVEELMTVPGIGKKRAERLIAVLAGDDDDDGDDDVDPVVAKAWEWRQVQQGDTR